MATPLPARIDATIAVLTSLKNESVVVDHAAKLIVTSLRAQGKLIVFGNGGSASDAQHIAAELVGRYLVERRALAAIALTVNTSALTAIANDYGYEQVFARQLEAVGRPGDVCLALSTSGNSANVLEAVRTARRIGLTVIGMTGRSGGRLRELCDVCICVPSDDTPRIQEAHILVGHVLCEVAEQELK